MTLLSLFEHQGATGGTRVVYDVDHDEAHFGAAAVHGPALVWTLGDDAPSGALLSAPVSLDAATDWLVRCDRVDFPPGSIAYRHTHPGPGIRCMLFGELTVETEGTTATYGPGGAWFESGPAPVRAVASPTEDSAFVRVLLLPGEWQGKRTIRYVDPADVDRPKLQRARVYFEQPL